MAKNEENGDNEQIAEKLRLKQARERSTDWKLWGPYVSERAWGTVREDYSPDGAAWDYFPFEQAHLKAFRWNEDGIAGICDRSQNLCFSVALWNGSDPILKERLFGLGGPKGNHGEDVKEYYYYLDSTPTHSYMKFLYKYVQGRFPYETLYSENANRSKSLPEFELIDTGIFNEDKYFDVVVEYAKNDAADIFIKISTKNNGPERATLTVLPTIWFRNDWSWFVDAKKPTLRLVDGRVKIEKEPFADHTLDLIDPEDVLFCENETNYGRLSGGEDTPLSKDAIARFIVNGDKAACNPEKVGTKAAAKYTLELEPDETRSIYLRLRRDTLDEVQPITQEQCEDVFAKRIKEADEFYDTILKDEASDEFKTITRQALAGMMWSKQFYNYSVRDWLKGDPAFPPPPESRKKGRNKHWKNLYNSDVISMPDKWEYPWYACWDTAFHCIALAMVDPDFAKRQLILFLREWYMHPNGQLPAYEWALGDVNPPVHAWAALRVYRIEQKNTGNGDRKFLERIFQKLLLNFTWWVNRKDALENNVFEGGFLGLDNIGVFDRSAQLPTGGFIEQSDGTSWMAMYSLNMLAIALELAKYDRVYEDVASKFFEHFVYISHAMNNVGGENTSLWDDEDGFYYDVLHLPGSRVKLKVRSMVGIVPLFAVETLEAEWLENLPNFKRRTEWFLENRSDLTDGISCMQHESPNRRHLLSIVSKEKLITLLQKVLDENEFLSPHGIRSLSRKHLEDPYRFYSNGQTYSVAYEPAESLTGMFGGNSNWRGPIWFPMNYLIVESLQKLDYFYGDEVKVEFPTGSGNMLNLWQVSQEIEKRLASLFLLDANGSRPYLGDDARLQNDPKWRDNILFYEYFDGDNGRGLGASHQTGWTGLIAKILKQISDYDGRDAERGAGKQE